MPIGYWSRTLIPAELNYSTTKRECLAAVWAVHHLRPYLKLTRFTVRTDRHAIKWLCSSRWTRDALRNGACGSRSLTSTSSTSLA